MKPDVKKYLNCYQYLQDIYQHKKSVDSLFSYDAWAKELDAGDKSYVRMMVFGKRPINEKMTEKFLENLELQDDDKSYFLDLVQYTQSKNSEQKKFFGRKLISRLKDNFVQMNVMAHFEFLSNPLLPRLQVALSFRDIDQSDKKLAAMLGVETIEITNGLAKLLELNLIQKEGNLYKPTQSSFKVADSFYDVGLDSFYTQCLDEAKRAISLPKEERRYKTLLMPLNESEFLKFIDNLNIFTREQLATFDKDELEDRRIYQVHMNVIPVTSK